MTASSGWPDHCRPGRQPAPPAPPPGGGHPVPPVGLLPRLRAGRQPNHERKLSTMSYVPSAPPVGDEIFLLKMGEMVLKGLNRRTFEERLMATPAAGCKSTASSASTPASPSPTWSPRRPGATWTGPLPPSPACSGWWACPGQGLRKRPPRPSLKPPRPTSTTT